MEAGEEGGGKEDRVIRVTRRAPDKGVCCRASGSFSSGKCYFSWVNLNGENSMPFTLARVTYDCLNLLCTLSSIDTVVANAHTLSSHSTAMLKCW